MYNYKQLSYVPRGFIFYLLKGSSYLMFNLLVLISSYSYKTNRESSTAVACCSVVMDTQVEYIPSTRKEAKMLCRTH